MKKSKKTNNLERIHQKTIQYTIPNTLVKQQTLIICILTEKIANILSVQKQKIYITTKCLKHLYDKKPAAIYDFILINFPRAYARGFSLLQASLRYFVAVPPSPNDLTVGDLRDEG